ncbi:hypothetical protein [Pseudomonas zeae]|uniref:hypothetical protein n=1 Tax=Pseudomonas zeae TaxID=2745510 RepID=UPI0039E1283F
MISCFPQENDYLNHYQSTSPAAQSSQVSPVVPSQPAVVQAELPPLIFVRDYQSMFSHGLMTMQTIMMQLTQSGNDLFAQMSQKSAEARDMQDQANAIESLIAKLEKPSSTLGLPEEIIKFMMDRKILVEGKFIDDYLLTKPWDPQEKHRKLDKGDLMSIKSAFESISGRASDFNQQNQLKLQQVMQNYSTSSQLMQSVQSMLAEMTKGTAAAIR